MGNLFVESDRAPILGRLGRLQPEANRHWGRMDAAQMLTHCALVLEIATGDRPKKRSLIGRLLGPFARGSMLGDTPFRQNLPTAPFLVVADRHEFDAEMSRLLGLISRLCELGPEHAGEQNHAFLGRLSGEEWGCLMHKHLDHHLRQFGV